MNYRKDLTLRKIALQHAFSHSSKNLKEKAELIKMSYAFLLGAKSQGKCVKNPFFPCPQKPVSFLRRLLRK